MKAFLKRFWPFILTGLVVLICVSIISVFQKRNNDLQAQQKLFEREREAISRERDALRQQLQEKTDQITRYQKTDSLLKISIDNTKKAIDEVSKQKAFINGRIDRFSSDELKRYFSDLK